MNITINLNINGDGVSLGKKTPSLGKASPRFPPELNWNMPYSPELELAPPLPNSYNTVTPNVYNTAPMPSPYAWQAHQSNAQAIDNALSRSYNLQRD